MSGILVLIVALFCVCGPIRRPPVQPPAPHQVTVRLHPAERTVTSPSGAYRWLDIADQVYSDEFQRTFTYRSAKVRVYYQTEGPCFRGTLTASRLKPNFAYQIKLIGDPDAPSNERIGLTGRWWEQEWTGAAWSNGANLNNKGDGSRPSPNDTIYFTRRDILADNPFDRRYRYTGYLALDYFVTDSEGRASISFTASSSYHVFWKTSQRPSTVHDGQVRSYTFDLNPRQHHAYAVDYPEQTVGLYGEWERLPMGDVALPPGDYQAQFVLTEESFHGSGGALAGTWASTMAAPVAFRITPDK